MTTQRKNRSLEAQREEFADRKFLAMPIAGMIAWALIAMVGATMSLTYQV